MIQCYNKKLKSQNFKERLCYFLVGVSKYKEMVGNFHPINHGVVLLLLLLLLLLMWVSQLICAHLD
jgi:hypothetical protein